MIRYDSWPDAQVEALRVMWVVQDKTASECAAALHLSRNAICGKVWRMGWTRDPAVTKANNRRANDEKIGKTRAYAPRPAKPPLAPKLAPRPILPEISEDLPHKRPWLERGPQQCAWPIGYGADTWSCCAPTSGSVYCTLHHRKAHIRQTPSDKRSQDRGDLYAAKRAA